MSASTWVRLVNGVLLAGAMLVSVAGTSSSLLSLVLTPPMLLCVVLTISALFTLCELSGWFSSLPTSTSVAGVGAAALLSIKTPPLLPVLPYNLTSPERENTVGLVATFLQCLNPIMYSYLPILQYHNSRHALLGKTLGKTLMEVKKQQLHSRVLACNQ